MADPLSIVSSVSNTIKTIERIRGNWNDADLKFLSISSQLIALRAAICKIQEWQQNATSDQDSHHQLVMDVDVSLSCIELLVSRIDLFLSELDQTTDTSLDFKGKLKLVFNNRNLDDVQKLIQCQTSALSLLLTACHCNTMAEQKQLLEKPKTRKLLGRAKSDSASLLVLRDNTSFISRCTDNLSKLSAVFGFDDQLFSSGIYRNAARRSLKESIRKGHRKSQSAPSSIPLLSPITETQELTQRILVLGPDYQGRCQAIHCMGITYEKDYMEQNVWLFRGAIIRNVIDNTNGLIDEMASHGIKPHQYINNVYHDELRKYCRSSNAPRGFDNEIGAMIESLWNDPCIPDLLTISSKFSRGGAFENAAYFFGDLLRISNPNYTPSNADILAARNTLPGNHELDIQIGSNAEPVNILNMINWSPSALHERPLRSIIVVISLASYAPRLPQNLQSHAQKVPSDITTDETNQEQTFESTLNYIEGISAICRDKNCPLILLFTQDELFGKKLKVYPLENYYADYVGGADFQDAFAFLVSMCERANVAGVPLIHFLMYLGNNRFVKRIAAVGQGGGPWFL
ncbi:G-protein alpha subunit-domain-containing protein [Dendryphion nanum]|uniref:G-protein alpha subunit-domain-containing protein n=1 Tax=Dendryphion nanum TaxID=256645 RepID=A0A9P9EM30_9PLEO|nr:G-protein alpha subunit-domain-containing protein [Dendryphion nanum]